MVESGLSGEASKVTLLPSPTNLSVSTSGSGAVALSWVDESDNEDGFNIFRSTDNSSWSKITTVNPGTTSYTDTGLLSGEKYYYYVDSQTEHTNSSSSTQSATTPLTSPSNLTAQGISTSEIELTWTDNSTNEDGFSIRYTEPGVNFYVEYSTVSANTTSTVVSGLTEDTEYDFRVVAYTEDTESSSNVVTETTTFDRTRSSTANIGEITAWTFTDFTSLELMDYEVAWNDSTVSWYTKWFQESRVLGREDSLVIRGSTRSEASDSVAEVVVEYDKDGDGTVDRKSEPIQIRDTERVHDVEGIPADETGWYRIKISKYGGNNTLYSLDFGLVN